MIRDAFRAVCAVVVMATAAALLIDLRLQLAAIDVAHRQAVAAGAGAGPGPAVYACAPPQPGRLAAVGRAAVGLADAALGVVR